MRPRGDIEREKKMCSNASYTETTITGIIGLQLEVLLDIRDLLLRSLNRQEVEEVEEVEED